MGRSALESSLSPESLFSEPDIDALVHIIGRVNTNANFPANAPPSDDSQRTS